MRHRLRGLNLPRLLVREVPLGFGNLVRDAMLPAQRHTAEAGFVADLVVQVGELPQFHNDPYHRQFRCSLQAFALCSLE
jgi:hypothetical protein